MRQSIMPSFNSSITKRRFFTKWLRERKQLCMIRLAPKKEYINLINSAEKSGRSFCTAIIQCTRLEDLKKKLRSIIVKAPNLTDPNSMQSSISSQRSLSLRISGTARSPMESTLLVFATAAACLSKCQFKVLLR